MYRKHTKNIMIRSMWYHVFLKNIHILLNIWYLFCCSCEYKYRDKFILVSMTSKKKEHGLTIVGTYTLSCVTHILNNGHLTRDCIHTIFLVSDIADKNQWYIFYEYLFTWEYINYIPNWNFSKTLLMHFHLNDRH